MLPRLKLHHSGEVVFFPPVFHGAWVGSGWRVGAEYDYLPLARLSVCNEVPRCDAVSNNLHVLRFNGRLTRPPHRLHPVPLPTSQGPGGGKYKIKRTLAVVCGSFGEGGEWEGEGCNEYVRYSNLHKRHGGLKFMLYEQTIK